MKTSIETSQPPADFSLLPSGAISLFQPHTEKARAWLALHCTPSSDHQYYGDDLVVEHRYVSTIILLASMAGLRPLDFSSRNDQNPAA